MNVHSLKSRWDTEVPRTEEANQQIREQRRAQILEAAARVFAQRGLTDTRIADIAHASGMSQGLIYRYFDSKEQVFAELVEGTQNLMLGLLRRAETQEQTGLGRLRFLTANLLPFLYEKPEGAAIIQHALTNQTVPDAVRQLALDYTCKVQETIEGYIVQGQQEGQITPGDPEQLAMLYLATLQGLSVGAGFMKRPARGFPAAETVLRYLRPE
jgi:AcrR family transcriptional regulator